MRNLLLLLIFTAVVFSVNAQSGNGIYQVRSGKDANRIIPYEGRYQFAEFRDGEVHFRNGKISKAKLNYSRVHGEVMFISPARDTMLFADAQFIDHIQIDQDLFYYQQGHGHIRITRDFGPVKLGRKEFLAQIGHEKYASYGQYSATSAISSYSTFVNSTGEYQFLNINDRVMMKKRDVFFLVDKNNTCYLANRNNLLKVFPSKRSAINRYLRENGMDLEAEHDLEKVLAFCSSL